MTALAKYLLPDTVSTPLHILSSIISFVISFWHIVRFGVFSKVFLISLEYSCLSACALRECTAGPFDAFNILDCINVLSIHFPISPPSASSSLTRCPLELPPIFGLHGIKAMESTLTVNITVFSPSLALASAASHPA